MKNALVCAGHNAGFSNFGDAANQWWVCSDPDCLKPTEHWFAATGDVMLNLFRGGPMDGDAYETTVLLSISASQLPLADYTWTPELITSPSTGRTARVWRFTSEMTDEELATAATTRNPQAAAPAAAPGAKVDKVAAATSAAAKSSGKFETAGDPELVRRRKALGIGRFAFLPIAGVNISQLEKAELGGVVKAETIPAIIAALDKLEAEQAGGRVDAGVMEPPGDEPDSAAPAATPDAAGN